MISQVDQAIEALLRRDVLDGASVELTFEAPTKDWAAQRSVPTIDVFLYDLREDATRRQRGQHQIRDDDGKIVSRAQPPRFIALSYLLTAWTQHPQDEHQLLSAALTALLQYDVLPPDLLAAELTEHGPVSISVARPPLADQSSPDVWQALGGQLKPGLDITITAPIVPGTPVAVAPLVQEQALVSLHEMEAVR